MSILINLLLAFNVIVCLLLIFLVLMQRPKSEGLGAAFGGGMTENIFGAQTTNVLANATRWLGGIFFGLTLLLSILTSRVSAHKSSLSQDLANSPKPVATAKPNGATDSSKAAEVKKALEAAGLPAAAGSVATSPAAASATPAASPASPASTPAATPVPAASAAPASPAPSAAAAPAGK